MPCHPTHVGTRPPPAAPTHPAVPCRTSVLYTRRTPDAAVFSVRPPRVVRRRAPWRRRRRMPRLPSRWWRRDLGLRLEGGIWLCIEPRVLRHDRRPRLRRRGCPPGKRLFPPWVNPRGLFPPPVHPQRPDHNVAASCCAATWHRRCVLSKIVACLGRARRPSETGSGAPPWSRFAFRPPSRRAVPRPTRRARGAARWQLVMLPWSRSARPRGEARFDGGALASGRCGPCFTKSAGALAWLGAWPVRTN